MLIFLYLHQYQADIKMKRILYTIILFSILSIPASRGMNHYWNDISTNYPIEKLQTSSYRIISIDQTITINQLVPGSFVTIFDASGRNIYKQTIKENSISVPVRYKGIYIVRIARDKNIFTQKVLVK